MRKVSESKIRKQFGAKRLRAVWEDGDSEIKTVDWRDSVNEVLKEVDAQLALHNLEIILHDTGDDNYVWHIEKRLENARDRLPEEIPEEAQ